MKKLIKEKKKELVSKLTDDIKESKINLLVGFSGLSVTEMQGLRNDLSGLGCSMKVVKNTLLEKIYENINLGHICTGLKGPIFIVWSKGNEEISVLKKLLLFKEEKQKIDFKIGIINNKIFDEMELIRIGRLSNKQQIDASVVFALRMPFIRIINALRFPATRIIHSLNYIVEKQSSVKIEK